MKLKTAVTIETIVFWVTIVLRLPLWAIAKMFEWLSNIIDNMYVWVGYKLCRKTKEFDMVKDENVRNSKYFGAGDLDQAIKNGLI